MNIGIPKERRPFEFRVGVSPAGVEVLSQQGHTVFVENDVGVGAGFSDQTYERAGAMIVYSPPKEVFGRADLLFKISRPMQEELDLLNPGATLMGILLQASAKKNRVEGLLKNKISANTHQGKLYHLQHCTEQEEKLL